jgi:hypothetical protein
MRRAGIISLALVAAVTAAVLAWFSCFAVTDFSKKVVYYDGGSGTCSPETENEDCDVENCQHCDEETNQCASDLSRNAENNDGDNAFVCDGGGTDCDDSDNQVFPGAAERCNLVDDDCDGTIDEGLLFQAQGAGAKDAGPGANPAVDFNGQNVAMVWEVEETEGTYQKRIKFATLSNGGEIPSQQFLTEGFSNYNMENPSIAYRLGSDMATEYGVAWIDRLGGHSLCFARFTAPGPSLGPGGFSIVAGEPGEQISLPSVAAWGGVRYYAVAWQKQQGSDASTADVFLAFFDAENNGALIADPGVINVSESDGVKSTFPSVAQVGGGFVVVWVEEESESASRLEAAYYLAPTGARVGETAELGIEPARRPSHPLLAAHRAEPADTSLYLVYDAVPASESRQEIFAVMMDSVGFEPGSEVEVFSSPVQVSHTPDVSVTPSVYWQDAMIGIGWSEWSDSRTVHFVRMTPEAVVASDPIEVGLGQAPAVVSQGMDDDFISVWYKPGVEADEVDTVYVRLLGCSG